MIDGVLIAFSIFLIVIIVIIKYLWDKYKNKFEMDFAKEHDDVVKFLTYYDLFVRWIELKQDGRKIEEYFEENDYKNVIVYGMKEAGVLLYNEIKNIGLNVYAMDKEPERLNLDIDIYKLSDGIPNADVIVITPVHYYEEIKEELVKKTSADIVSIEDVIWYL